MKVRDSGMPEEAMWSGFFDPYLILRQMEINSEIDLIADLGCGFGTFSIPASKIVKGKVLAFDIENEMIELIKTKINLLKINNVELFKADFIADGTGLQASSIDYAMIFNILHHEHPDQILIEVFRILRKGAKAGIVHWRSDVATPRGPALAIRPKPSDCAQWAIKTGFHICKDPFIIEPYHFGLIIQKP